MKGRGSYRSIHTVIVDGPDFQALSPGAKLVWYTLKMTLGPSGIDVVPALVGTLMERTGLEAAPIEKGLAQLEAAGWISRERSIVWMIDGLKHDPHFSLTNHNHRVKIAEHLSGLPRLAIVDAFRAHYGFSAQPVEMPSTPAEHGLSDASKMASHKPSNMASKKPSRSREKGEGKREEGKGRGIRDEGSSAAGASGTGASSRSGRTGWLTPFADAWRGRYGGEMSAGKAVKALHRLVEAHGSDEVLRRWGIYLGATAAEYANAPKFAETWGRWTAAVVRSSGASTGAPTLSARDESRAEAGAIVGQLRALVYDQPIPGQGFRRLLRLADVEALGADIAAAVKNTGGVPQILKLDRPDTSAADLSYYIGDFAAALAVARRTGADATPEAASA